MRKIKLDNYLDKNTKMIVLFVCLFFVFRLMSSIQQTISFTSLLDTLLNLVILSFLYVIIKLKKSLIFENGILYNALTFENFVFYRVKINTENYIYGEIERLDQSTGFWPSFGPITSLMREYNFASIILSDKKKNQIKILSLTDVESIKKAVEFIEKFTEIKFPENSLKKY
ncbi:MAG: hypothetical protein APF83_11265 [Lutibacter sp. BRH_c52]|nr:MAG: hypothetical protein APF83_11265 [Lutibacter sp. BRH_c52]